MTAPASFDLQNISKTFQSGESRLAIINQLTFRIPAGQYTAIMGPSGSGKSTLMRVMGCLEEPTSGRLSVQGQQVAGLTDDAVSHLRCRAIGFVFQGFHLLPGYDAVNNVALAMAYSEKRDRRQRAEKLLRRLGLGHRLHHRPHTLSGGEQQRVAIARALANDPPILLADEPTGALDQANGRAILDIMDEFHREGRTIVLVTHDEAVGARAQRVVRLVDGKIQDDRMQHRQGA